MPVASSSALKLSQLIDHTKLTFKPDENPEQQIEKICQQAIQHGFYAVCIPVAFVAQAKTLLEESTVKTATVIGFPKEKTTLEVQNRQTTIGSAFTEDKLREVAKAVELKADELDVVINVAQFKADFKQAERNHWPDTTTYSELSKIKQAAGPVPIKLIVETDLLSEDEIMAAVQLCHQLQLFMIKTSTGMITDGHGATVETIQLMNRTIDRLESPLTIKASGGIKNKDKALQLIDAGASRLGTSKSVAIVEG